ncbi:MAG: hypothetical protein ACK6DV_29400, partial [Deltaproteobacteria bacterium]
MLVVVREAGPVSAPPCPGAEETPAARSERRLGCFEQRSEGIGLRDEAGRDGIGGDTEATEHHGIVIRVLRGELARTIESAREVGAIARPERAERAPSQRLRL